MNFMKYFYLGIISLLTVISSYAQVATGSVYGKVIDKFSKEPLIGANVIIIGTDLGAATNALGEFSINNIPPNVYQVRASVIGYNSITKTDISVMPGRPAIVVQASAA